MDFKECLTFATENPICYLATTDGDQPRVRAVMLVFANEHGFYFETVGSKDMFKQMKQNSKVEICFYNNPAELAHARQMRLTGEVEFVKDPALKHRLHEERKFLDDIAGENLEKYNEIIKVAAGDVHFWTMMDVLKETQLEHLVF